jgi:hypothetical protein
MLTIHYTIHTADFLDLDYTDDEVDTYEVNLHNALVDAYPAADVTVEQVKRVSGGPVIRIESDEDERAVEANVREIADRVLSAL